MAAKAASSSFGVEQTTDEAVTINSAVVLAPSSSKTESVNGQDSGPGHATEGSNSAPAPKSPKPSKFDPQLYRKAQTVRMDDAVGLTTKVQTVIPVRKPSKKQFVMAHSLPEYRVDGLPTIVDETTGDIYLVAADMEIPPDLENKIDYLNLTAAINLDGSVFLWHYKNTTNSWSESARIAIREASNAWVRVIPDKSSNGYILETPMVKPVMPTWPKLTFTEMLEKAFGARYIDSLDHPLVKTLRGQFNA